MVSKKETVALWVDVLESRLKLGEIPGRDRQFAEGVVKFYQHQGRLSEKQIAVARKIALRCILELDPFFLS